MPVRARCGAWRLLLSVSWQQSLKGEHCAHSGGASLCPSNLDAWRWATCRVYMQLCTMRVIAHDYVLVRQVLPRAPLSRLTRFASSLARVRMQLIHCIVSMSSISCIAVLPFTLPFRVYELCAVLAELGFDSPRPIQAAGILPITAGTCLRTHMHACVWLCALIF